MVDRFLDVLVDSYGPVPLTMVSHTRSLRGRNLQRISDVSQGNETHPNILDGIPRLPGVLRARPRVIVFLLLSRHRHRCTAFTTQSLPDQELVLYTRYALSLIGQPSGSRDVSNLPLACNSHHVPRSG